ncbi:MAG: hypothetical protein AB7O38_21175 [Pirellulaceae bacterium]
MCIRGERNFRLAQGLNLLRQSSDYAAETGSELWDFAVELRFLRDAGLTISDVRWLLIKGYIEHGRELTEVGEHRRSFRPCTGLTVSRSSCFVITAAGIQFSTSVSKFATPPVPSSAATGGAVNSLCEPSPSWDRDAEHPGQIPDAILLPANGRAKTTARGLVPRWDCDYREIRYDNRVVKQFKLPSPNQEAILLAFEEEGWPPRIDDPLPPHPECDPKQRLHDTIRSLNRNQKNRLLRFKGDGTGQGVLWEAVAHSEDAVASSDPL